MTTEYARAVHTKGDLPQAHSCSRLLAHRRRHDIVVWGWLWGNAVDMGCSNGTLVVPSQTAAANVEVSEALGPVAAASSIQFMSSMPLSHQVAHIAGSSREAIGVLHLCYHCVGQLQQCRPHGGAVASVVTVCTTMVVGW